MTSEVYEAAFWAIGAIARGLMQYNSDDPGVLDCLERLADQDLGEGAICDTAPTRRSVTRFLPETIARSLMVSDDIAASLASLEEHLCWTGPPAGGEQDPESDQTAGSAGVAELIGPGGLFAGNGMNIGYVLLASDGVHAGRDNVAAELTWFLTGPAEWRNGSGDWLQKGAGDTLWRDHHVEPIAIRAMGGPLLAVSIGLAGQG